MVALAEFLAERLPALRVEWHAHREELRASGKLSPWAAPPLSPDDMESSMTSESNPSYQSDVAALRERVDNGDSDAADELIELATEQSDMGELRRLAETGNSTAADQLIELATEQGDLAELRRLADQGNTTAAEVLDELLDE